MKAGNSNPMGLNSGIGKPDAGVVRSVQAKVSANLNKGNTIVPKAAKLNRPTADSKPSVNSMERGILPKPAKAKLHRKPRTK